MNSYEKLYESLYTIEKLTLSIIVKRFGVSPFEWSHLKSTGKGYLSDAEIKAGLVRLRQKGIIFTLRKAWGEHAYSIPHDVFPEWHQIIIEEPALDASASNAETVKITHQAKQGFLHDLFQFLVYAARQGLPLTQKGSIHKRYLQKISENIHLKDEDAAELRLSHVQQRMYPPAFAVILDTALKLGLVRIVNENITICPQGMAKWMDQTPWQMEEQLFHLAAFSSLPHKAWLQHAVFSIKRLPGDTWFSVNELLEWLVSQGVEAHDRPEMGRQLVDCWLKPASAFGWLQLGIRNDGRLVFSRIDPLPPQTDAAAQDKFFVQPDFEIIIPPTVSYSIRWEMECIADYEGTDQVSRYRISKSSIHRGCEYSRSVKDIAGFLEKYSIYGLASNVKQTIKEWAEQFGQAAFAKVIGISPKKTVDAEAGEEQSEFPFFIAEGLQSVEKILDSSCSVHKASAAPDEMETSLPTPEEMYPGLHEIPSMWLNDSRAYHPSTRRKMIEKAIECGAYVRLRINSETAKFIPAKLLDTQDGWRISGWNNGRDSVLSPEEWEEMQLILPGINDKTEVVPHLVN
jgi:hypothetical protein